MTPSRRFAFATAFALSLAGCSDDSAPTAAAPNVPGQELGRVKPPKPCVPLTSDPSLAPEVPECLARSVCSNQVFVLQASFALSPDSRRLVALTDASGEGTFSFADQRATLVRLDDLSIENSAKDDTFKMQQGNLALDESGRFVLSSLMGGASDPFTEFAYEFGHGGRQISHAEADLFRARVRGIPVKHGAARFRITRDENLGRTVGLLLDVATGEEAVDDAFDGFSNVSLRNFAAADDGETVFFTQGSGENPNAEDYRETLYRLPLTTGKAVKALDLPGRYAVNAIAPVPRSNGREMAVMRWNTFSVFDLETGKAITETNNWSSEIRALDDGKRILHFNAVLEDEFGNSYRTVDIASGEVATLEKEGRQPLLYSPHAHAMIEMLSKSTAIVRDTESAADLCKFGLGEYRGPFIPGWRDGLNLSADGKTLAYTTKDGRVVMVRLEAPASR